MFEFSCQISRSLTLERIREEAAERREGALLPERHGSLKRGPCPSWYVSIQETLQPVTCLPFVT